MDEVIRQLGAWIPTQVQPLVAMQTTEFALWLSAVWILCIGGAMLLAIGLIIGGVRTFDGGWEIILCMVGALALFIGLVAGGIYAYQHRVFLTNPELYVIRQLLSGGWD